MADEIDLEFDPKISRANLDAFEKQLTNAGEYAMSDAMRKAVDAFKAKIEAQEFKIQADFLSKNVAFGNEAATAGKGVGYAAGTEAGAGLGGAALLGGGLMAAGAAFVELTKSAAGFVQAANPAVANLFNETLKDITAVIGHTLTPYLEQATQVVRIFGDFVSAVLPTSAEMREMLRGFDPVIKQLRTTMEQLAPVVKDVFIASLKMVVDAFLWASKQIASISDKLFGRLAIGWAVLMGDMEKARALSLAGGGPPLPTSFGAAAHQASFASAGQYGQNLILGALQAGTSPMDRNSAATDANTEATRANTEARHREADERYARMYAERGMVPPVCTPREP